MLALSNLTGVSRQGYRVNSVLGSGSVDSAPWQQFRSRVKGFVLSLALRGEGLGFSVAGFGTERHEGLCFWVREVSS